MNQKIAICEPKQIPEFLQYCTEDSPRLALFKLVIQNENLPDFDVSKTIQTLKKKVFGQRTLNEPDMLEDFSRDAQFQFVDKSCRLYFTPEQFRMFKTRSFNAKAFQAWLTANTSRQDLEGQAYCYSTADLYAMYKALESANKSAAFQQISQGVISSRLIPVEQVEGYDDKQSVQLPPLKRTPAKTPHKIVKQTPSKQGTKRPTSIPQPQEVTNTASQKQVSKPVAVKISPTKVQTPASHFEAVPDVQVASQGSKVSVETPRMHFEPPINSSIARVPSPPVDSFVQQADESLLMMQTVDLSKSKLQYLAQDEVDARHEKQRSMLHSSGKPGTPRPEKSSFYQVGATSNPLLASQHIIAQLTEENPAHGFTVQQESFTELQIDVMTEPFQATVVHIEVPGADPVRIAEEIQKRKDRIQHLRRAYEDLKQNKKETFLYSVDVMGYVGDYVEKLEEYKATAREHEQTIAFIREFEIDDSQ